MPALVRALNRVGVDASVIAGQAGVDRVEFAAVDVVHDHGIWRPFHHAVAREAERSRVLRVVSPRGMLEPWALADKRLKKMLGWQLYQRGDLTSATALHVTSEAEAEGVRTTGLRVPLVVIPNGVDIPAVLPERIRSGARRALFLSRIHPKKGLPLLVDAWARVRATGWELLIAGPDEGGHRAVIEALVQTAGLSDVISFAGTIADADKWALYRTADLFVLPTHSENFGLVVAEALGAGVPVLTTKGAPWRELNTHRCGWWTDVSVDAIADSLRAATQTPRAALDAMGTCGQKLVLDRYGWDDAARQMKAVYEWLLREGERPACVYLE